jgi:hypothetical protein
MNQSFGAEEPSSGNYSAPLSKDEMMTTFSGPKTSLINTGGAGVVQTSNNVAGI